MRRIIRSVGLPTCQVCQKSRQTSFFFKEHNPDGQYVTCKYCSLSDQIKCLECASTHTRKEMLKVLGTTRCPNTVSITPAPAEPVTQPTTVVPSQDLLIVLVKTLELLADKVSNVELILKEKITEPADYTKYESAIKELENREREALEDFCRAEDARKVLEAENERLRTELQEKEDTLLQLGSGREQLLQQLWRVHDVLKT